MINFDNYANENKTERNPKWSYTLDHPCRILIIGGFGSGKTSALLNFKNLQKSKAKGNAKAKIKVFWSYPMYIDVVTFSQFV